MVWTNAHNGYIQTLLETGIVGFLLLASAAAIAVLVVIRLVRAGPESTRLVGLGVLGAAAAVGIHNTVDTVTAEVPLMMLAALFGMALGGKSNGELFRPFGVRVTAAPVLIVPLVVALTIGPQLAYLDGYQAVLAGDLESADSGFALAFVGDSLPVYAQALSFARTSREGPSGGDVPMPETWVDPPSMRLNVAAIDVDGFSDLFLEAAKQVAGDEVGLVAWGEIAMNAGSDSDAAVAFADAVTINPWLSSSPFLLELEGELRDRVLSMAFEESKCSSGDIWILAGAATKDQLGEILAVCDSQSRSGMVARTFSGASERVQSEAESALVATPDDMFIRRIAGVAALESGDRGGARKHLTIAALLGDPFSAWLLWTTYQSGMAPAEVEALVDRLSVGYSPVLVASAPEPVYRFGAISMRSVGKRDPLPTTLRPGLWSSAVTQLHLMMEQAE